jgi:hypothetical protein
VLQIAEDQGFSLVGISEDMAKTYQKSLKLAGKKEVKAQKDIWHVDKMLEKIKKHDEFETLLGHLHEALTLVDIRKGYIHDFETAEWYLHEIIGEMEKIEHRRTQKFAKTLRNHQKDLLVFLQWTEQSLIEFDAKLASVLPDEDACVQFKEVLARSWRLDQAVINGHAQWKKEAEKVNSSLQIILDANSQLDELALLLRQILDASGRTSSIIEALNGILKSFLKSRKSFKNQETMQSFLNLFILWHNMRVYEKRAKRGGKSPFQWAGIDLGESDWLSLLGYLPAK